MAQQIRFGVYKVDVRAGEITKHDTRIRLQDRPFQILVALLNHPGEVVTREELRQQLWADGTFVDFDHSISSAINKLRTALGDTAANPKFIDTVGRRGYRFIYPIETIETPAKTPAPIPSPAPIVPIARAQHLRSIPWLWIAVALAVVIGAGAAYRLLAPPTDAPIRSIAVLPLKNLSNSADEEFFSEGLTDELITKLASLEGIRVISRTSVMHYKDTQKTLPEIARELHVDGVIEGSVLRVGDRVRITVQLVEGASDRHLWASSYEREERDILNLQNEVTRQIADNIKLTLNPDARKRLETSKNIDPQALENYLRGRYYWNKRSVPDLRTAVTYFEKAISIEPRYAKAYAGLADSYALVAAYTLEPPRDNVEKARTAALEALLLDPQLAETHTSLALIYQNYDWNWQQAEAEYREAIALDQNYATAHHWYAELLSDLGRFDESRAEYARARQLDPLSLIIRVDDAVGLYYAHDYEAALKEFRAVQAIDPNYPRAHLISSVLAEQGRFEEAIADAEKMPNETGIWKQATLANLYARAGRKADAQQIFTYLEDYFHRQPQLNPAPMVFACIGMGFNNEAIVWLQKAHRLRSTIMTTLQVDPSFDPLRSDPRFQDLLRRHGLAE
jgi:TolB-like protein/DNA-binding winged helix-turn-helix (wHTH) protein/Tfp pilus assembly protein PilF